MQMVNNRPYIERILRSAIGMNSRLYLSKGAGSYDGERNSIKGDVLDMGGIKGQHDCVRTVNIQQPCDVQHDLNVFPYPFKDASVDGIICYHTLEHLDKPLLVMNEIFRIAKKGAIVRIKVPYWRNWTSLDNPEHIHEFKPGWFMSFDSCARHGKRIHSGGKGMLYNLHRSSFRIDKLQFGISWIRVNHRIPKIIRPIVYEIFVEMVRS